MINKKNLIKEIERFIKEKNKLGERKESLIIEIENAEKEFLEVKHTESMLKIILWMIVWLKRLILDKNYTI